MPFTSLQLHPSLLKAIRELGFTRPTPIQAEAITPALEGRDILASAATGSGKTAAFLLPIVHRLMAKPRRITRALVLAPTRELAAQILQDLNDLAIHTPVTGAAVYGGVGMGPQEHAFRSGVDVLIATPGRLLDHFTRPYAALPGVEYLVLDEADRMLDMGFLPDIRRIVRALPQKRQTMLFCATLSKEIEGLTHEFLRTPKMVQIGRRSNPAETVTQFVYEVPHHAKMGLLIHLLRDPGMDMVLVFSRTKHGADKVARRLEQARVNTATLHSNRSQSQRLRALKDFKSGVVRVLVATDIAARGIDVDGISHVVNYDFPMHSEDYVHRIGRTGRAHAVGDAISFVTPEDRGPLRSLERFIGRGIVRKHAEGFDAGAVPPPSAFHPAERRDPARGGNRPAPGQAQQPPSDSGQRGGGGGRRRFGGRRSWR